MHFKTLKRPDLLGTTAARDRQSGPEADSEAAIFSSFFYGHILAPHAAAPGQ